MSSSSLKMRGYFFISCIIVITLIQLLFVTVVDAYSPDYNIDYQIHSNNDLNELYQLLLKGARRFKFDPHYVDSSHPSCKGENPCFLLNHDNPTKLSGYNTSTELLNYLVSSDYESIIPGDEYVSIALCFKSVPDKCDWNSTAFTNWVKLVDDFYAQATSPAIAKKNIEFILDGDAKPSMCLVGRWQPWKSVWITSTDPINSSLFYDNSTANDAYRFQVLNNPENVTNWEWMASPEVDYGKFSNASYPYQLWEPDAQEDFQKYKNMYLNGELHDAGYHFAINTDIALFRVYLSAESDIQTKHAMPPATGGETAMGINFELNEDMNGLNPVTTLFQPNQIASYFTSAGNKAGALFLSFLDVDQANYAVKVASKASLQLPNEISVNQLHLSDASTRLIRALTLSSSNREQMLVTSKGDVSIFSFTSAGKVTYSVGFNLGVAGYVTDVKVIDKVACSGQSEDYCLAIVSSNAEVPLVSLASITLVTDPTSGLVSANYNLLSSSSLSSMTTTTLSTSTESGRVVYDAKTDSFLLFLSQSTSSSSFPIIYGANVKRTALASSTVVTVSWKRLTVGKNVDAADVLVDAASGTDLLLLLSDSGYCYNSHSHNTRSAPTMCSSVPNAPPSLPGNSLDYSLGLVEDWIALLDSSTCDSITGDSACFAVTVCSREILHGTYDVGKKPSLLLLPPSESYNVMFVEVHEGFGSNDKDINSCGQPIRRDGLVVDSFRIVDWTNALLHRKAQRDQSLQ